MLFAGFRYILSRLLDKDVRIRVLNFKASDHSLHAASPKVTIIVPTRDKLHLLRACIESILSLTSYQNFEVLVIDNQSQEIDTLTYLEDLDHENVRVLKYDHEFNFSKICNFGAENSNSPFICFLNNDTEIFDRNWLTCLVSHGLKSESGVIGGLLTYGNGVVQHAGLAMGYKGIAGHVFAGNHKESDLPRGLVGRCYQTSAVTFACALIERTKFDLIGGLDPQFRVGLNDVDFCLRAQSLGLENLVCSLSRLKHFESQSRKSMFSVSGALTAIKEITQFIRKHPISWREDPYFESIRFK